MKVDLQRLAQFIEKGIPFNRYLGLRVEQLDRHLAIVRMPFVEQLVGDVFRPALHGGSLAALIDATAGAAAFTEATVQDRVSTIDLRIDYLRPAPKQDVIARAEVRRMGNRVAVVNVVVYPVDHPEEPVAEGRGVFSVRRDVGAPDFTSAAPPEREG